MTTIEEPARPVSVRADVDVVVCGAGAAGAAAALAAARAGATVALVEQHGFPGGVNTASGVNGVGGWQYDLDNTPLIRGLPLEIMRAVARAGGGNIENVERLSRPRPGGPDYRDGGLGCYWLQTNPEAVKIVLDDLLEQAGVRLFYHASAVRPISEGHRVAGVFMESKSGREALRARVVVDCTGDGDIAARAGAEFSIGRPEDGACQPMTTMYVAGNAQVSGLHYRTDQPDPETDPLVRNRYEGAVRLARERGEIRLNPNDLFCAAPRLDPNLPDLRSVNFTRVQRHSAIDVEELTRAEILGRRQVREAIGFMRKYMRGCANTGLAFTFPQIGIRESRRILGDYVLTGNDVRGATRFADEIARGIYLLDIHNPAEIGKPSQLVMLDAPYSIPFRCLLPRGIENLLVAGRCISGDHIALASYRVQSHCMALGQAAGTAAALAAKQHCSPRALNTGKLRAALRESGANVGPDN